MSRRVRFLICSQGRWREVLATTQRPAETATALAKVCVGGAEMAKVCVGGAEMAKVCVGGAGMAKVCVGGAGRVGPYQC